MERCKGKAKEEDQRALALVLDLAKEFERIIFFVVWSLATHFSFSRKILRVLCGNSEAPEACTVRRMCGRAANNHHGYPAKVEVEPLALTDCVAGCVQ